MKDVITYKGFIGSVETAIRKGLSLNQLVRKAIEREVITRRHKE